MMNRPSPLRLEELEESSFLGGQEAKKPLYMRLFHALVNRNWRRAVIAVAILNIVRFGLHANNNIQDRMVDISEKKPKLAHSAAVIAGMFTIAAFTQVFGVYAGYMKRTYLARFYVSFAFLAALLVCTAGLVHLSMYRTLKDDIVQECISLGISGKLWTKTLFASEEWPGSAEGQVLSAYDAPQLCSKAWAAHASGQVYTFLLKSILPSVFVVLVPFAYYRQLVNPAHPHASHSNFASAVAMDVLQETSYSPMYNSADSLGPAQRRTLVPQQNLSVSRVDAPNRRHAEFQGLNMPETIFSVGESSPYTPGPPSFSRSRVDRYETYGGQLSSRTELERFT